MPVIPFLKRQVALLHYEIGFCLDACKCMLAPLRPYPAFFMIL